MFRKYEKTYRIKVPQFDILGKHNLSNKDAQRLLSGKIIIEEKMDGANVGIRRTKKPPFFMLQKRNSLVGRSEHVQFNYFVNWAYNSCVWLNLPLGVTVYAELLFITHHIRYTHLPSYILVFDIWDYKAKKYWHRNDVSTFCSKVGWDQVPLLYEGEGIQRKELVKYIPQKSAYRDGPPEGIVVKNYKKQMRGKLVRPEFIKELDEDGTHWMRQALRKNLLAKC